MRKFLKPLLIGELAPEEPSQDRGKNVSQNGPRTVGREGLQAGEDPTRRCRVLGVGQGGFMPVWGELPPIHWGQGGLRASAGATGPPPHPGPG